MNDPAVLTPHKPRKPLILVVDDDPMTQSIVRVALSATAVDCIQVSTGMDALVAVGQHSFDAILLDILMPGIDGFTTCSRLRNQPQLGLTPIIMMTGLEDVASVRKAFDCGATDFVTKPINLELLVQRLRFVLKAHETLESLHDQKVRLREAQRLANLGEWEWDCENGKIELSAQLRNMLQIPTELEFESANEFGQFVWPDDWAELKSRIGRLITSGQSFSFEHRIIASTGAVRVVRHDARALGDSSRTPDSGAGEPGQAPSRLLGIVQDVTHLRSAEERADYITSHDELTGLLNRNALMSRLENVAVARHRFDSGFALVTVDLDHFRRVNDSLGEVAGDSVLQEVARRLSLVARENARGVQLADEPDEAPYMAAPDETLIARVSGNEFALLFRLVRTMTELETIAQQLQTSVSQPYRIGEHEFVLTGSFGLALYPRHGDDAETVLRNASLAVRAAKERGRNRIVAFETSLAKGIKQQLSLEARLRAVIQEGRLEVAFQPRVCAQNGNLLSMEALARWSDDELGKVSPAEFIPVAEKHGLIDALGVHVMDRAIATCMRLNQGRSRSLSVSVNLSARQFAQASLVDVVEQALLKRSVDPSILEIEVTENVLIDDFERSIATMRSLRALGVRIALDDFGTGYASLNYLRLLPLSTVKVDRSFVCDLRPGGGESTILEAIVRMSHGLGMEVVMEGIETLDQLIMVKNIGVDEIQGFYVAQALSESDLLRWSESWNGFERERADPSYPGIQRTDMTALA